MASEFESSDESPQLKSTAGAETSGRVARSAGIIGLAVMGSRILGLVREQVFAAYFGAGMQYDAFLMAFRIPNLLRDLFAEGALSAAFVTVFSQRLMQQGEASAWRLANLVLNALILVLSVISLLGMVFSPQLVDWIAHGFRAVPGKTELTIEMTRIMFPFILLVAMAAAAMGILNTKDRFGVPASASSFFNIGSVAGGLACAYAFDPHWGPRAIVGMAMGTLIGGALQFLIQVPSLRGVGFRYQPIIGFTDPGVVQIMRLMAPAVIGAAAVQINVLVNSSFASYLGNGPVSWLSYAFRFMQFPIGIFGVAIGTATLPSISRAAAREDRTEFRQTISSSLGMVFLLCVPSACGLAVLGGPIIGLIYQRGQFTAYDTEQTAAALAFYAVGLAGYAAIRVLAPAFYALNDARTPMLISLGSIATNYVLNSLLVHRFGHRGLAMTTSAVALVNFFALFILMRRKIRRIEGRKIVSSLLRIAIASAVMSAVCWFAYRQVSSLTGGGLMAQLANALIPVAIGGLVFVLLGRLLAIPELMIAERALLSRFRRST